MKQLIICCVLLALALCQASVIPASVYPTIPVAAHAPVPGLVPVSTSHQFVTRNYNGYYVPTATTAWPGLATYPNTYYKYSGGYPTYTYPYNYPYGYYPSYPGYPSYGYGYKSVW